MTSGFDGRTVRGEADFTSRTASMDVSGNVSGGSSDEAFLGRAVSGMGPEALMTKVASSSASRAMAKEFDKVDSLIKDELQARDLLIKDDELQTKDLGGFMESLRNGEGKGAGGKVSDEDLLEVMHDRMRAQDRTEKLKGSTSLASQLEDRVDANAYGASILDESLSGGEGGGAATQALRTARQAGRFSDIHKARSEVKKLSKKASKAAGEMSKGSAAVERLRQMGRFAKNGAAAAARGLIAAGRMAAHALMAAANPITWVVAGVCLVLAFVLALFASCSAASARAIDNVPELITGEMIMAALEMQEEYGHPAGATLAQIIAESRGAYNGLSGLAYNYKNLFGMKYVNSFAGCEQLADPPYAKMGTQEWEGTGYVSTSARFCAFDSYESCIEFRSAVFLQSSTYTENPTLQQAIELCNSRLFAVGLADSWATSPTYAESLIEIIDEYGLDRFDAMSLETFLFGDVNVRGQEYDDATSKQKAVVDMAMTGRMWGIQGGYCQQWVATCYQKALGGSYQSGCCAYGCWLKWGVSSSKENIPVGAAVYNSGSGDGGGCHSVWGHVGIYVGDGYVVSNVNGKWHKQTLESFQTEGWYGWGWNGGTALNDAQ